MSKRNIIVMGASAGGFAALRTIIAGLPSDLQASLFVVWHMAADVSGILPDVLNKHEGLYASNARDRESIVPGRIYVAPPDMHLLLENGRVRTTRGPKENRFRPAVDPLFRSAAMHYGNRVIGVVLSGRLDDGASGLLQIKRAGGITIVQDPRDAAVPSMPNNALQTVDVDYCVPVSEIPALLVRLSAEEVDQVINPAVDDTQLRAELAVAVEGSRAARHHFTMGKLTPFVCPECDGALAQFDDGGTPRFRCHNGHAYTASSLLGSIAEIFEGSIYNAIRLMDESVMLLNQLGDHFAERNEAAWAAEFFQRANETEKRANALRGAVLDGGSEYSSRANSTKGNLAASAS